MDKITVEITTNPELTDYMIDEIKHYLNYIIYEAAQDRPDDMYPDFEYKIYTQSIRGD